MTSPLGTLFREFKECRLNEDVIAGSREPENARPSRLSEKEKSAEIWRSRKGDVALVFLTRLVVRAIILFLRGAEVVTEQARAGLNRAQNLAQEYGPQAQALADKYGPQAKQLAEQAVKHLQGPLDKMDFSKIDNPEKILERLAQEGPEATIPSHHQDRLYRTVYRTSNV